MLQLDKISERNQYRYFRLVSIHGRHTRVGELPIIESGKYHKSNTGWTAHRDVRTIMETFLSRKVFFLSPHCGIHEQLSTTHSHEDTDCVAEHASQDGGQHKGPKTHIGCCS